jgi:hypothetical protein
MKRIILIAATSALLGQPQISFGQKSVEPGGGLVATPGAPPLTESPTPPRSSSKRATQPATVSASGAASQFAANYFGNSSRGDSIPPVMIRFSAPDAKASAGLEEDLFVMARVISRTLQRAETDKVNYKLGVPMLLTGSGRSVRPMYLEGIGPLFMIKVNFALMRPPKTEEKAGHTPESDSEWTEAQRDVFGPEDAAPEESSVRDSSYTDEPVELLKKELVGSLKNAANIRGLKPEEFVNIAVFGHAAPARMKSTRLATGGSSAGYEMDISKGSVLTLRARKSDIDAFAAGKLEPEAFKAKVNMTAYAGSGSGITSINSWIQESTGRFRAQ